MVQRGSMMSKTMKMNKMTCNENIGTTSSINNLLAKTSQRHVFGVFQNSYCTPLSVITNDYSCVRTTITPTSNEQMRKRLPLSNISRNSSQLLAARDTADTTKRHVRAFDLNLTPDLNSDINGPDNNCCITNETEQSVNTTIYVQSIQHGRKFNFRI
nr:uncharacterized protein LOC109173751 [Ipomoea batatas]